MHSCMCKLTRSMSIDELNNAFDIQPVLIYTSTQDVVFRMRSGYIGLMSGACLCVALKSTSVPHFPHITHTHTYAFRFVACMCPNASFRWSEQYGTTISWRETLSSSSSLPWSWSSTPSKGILFMHAIPSTVHAPICAGSWCWGHLAPWCQGHLAPCTRSWCQRLLAPWHRGHPALWCHLAPRIRSYAELSRLSRASSMWTTLMTSSPWPSTMPVGHHSPSER